jgi:hypothetical protein
MAGSLSANVRNRRRRRDNHTDREGPQIHPTEPFEAIGAKVGCGSKSAVTPTAAHSRFTFNCGRTVALPNPSIRATALK